MTGNRRLRAIVVTAVTIVVLVGCDSTSMTEEFVPREGRGATISTSLLSEQTAEMINAVLLGAGLPLTAQYGVATYKIRYQTVDARGETTQASGALFIPQGAPGARPMISYQHGTLAEREEAPSAGGAEQAIGIILAADGYVAVLPDLLGLGDSPGFHPYVHAKASATAVVDMLRAAQDFALVKEITLNGQLFLAGYSQGGYTAMAAHRELEALHQNEFEVTASAPMAGPYDMSGVMADMFLAEQVHPEPYYLPYALLAYNEIYQLFASPSVFLASPYDELLPPLFDGEHSGGAINAVMPDIPRHILRADFIEAFESDPNHPLRMRLRENDLYDWTPQAPMRMYHCGEDRHVPQANSLVAFERFMERGATQVEFIDPDPMGDHGSCAAASLLLAKLWFDGMVP